MYLKISILCFFITLDGQFMWDSIVNQFHINHEFHLFYPLFK